MKFELVTRGQGSRYVCDRTRKRQTFETEKPRAEGFDGERCGTRTHDLFRVKEAARDDHGDTILALQQSVKELEAAVNRSAWLPVLASGVLVSVIAAIVVSVSR